MVAHNRLINPFPGIRSYEMEESHYFFGREKQVAELVNKLETTRFLAIVGSSGCGKSSLIKAGLIPTLTGYDKAVSSGNWLQLTFRPGSDPFDSLTKVLAGAKHPHEQIRKLLDSGSQGLVHAIKLIATPGQETLIYIDQFEELFRFGRTQQERSPAEITDRFIALLPPLTEESGNGIHLILSMRTDFLDDCTAHRELSELINKGYYLVPRMNDDERRLAITGPVSAAGAKISEALVDRLLQDTGDDPDQLPILQHAMMRSWDNWLMAGNRSQELGISHYEAIGTMKEALSVHLEEVFNSLGDERAFFLSEKIFKSLTDLSNQNRGTRRPTSLAAICTLTHGREDEIVRIIDHFRSPGCAFLMPPAHLPIDSETLIDISHESIMRVWQRLRRWVEEEGESAQLYLRLSHSAALYQEGKTALWVNPELQLALQWKENTRPNAAWAERYDPAFERAMTFLDQSKKSYEREIMRKEQQQKRNLLRARNSAIVLGFASVVSLLFLVISLNLRFKAEASQRQALEKEKMAVQERIRTEEQRKEAVVQRKISEQQQQIAAQQELIANEQRGYAVSQQRIAQQQTAEAIQQRQQADLARHEALTARDEARQQRREALTQKQIAETERSKAEESEREAQRLRMLAIANALATQAIQLHSTQADDTLALYALTAYKLHSENGGNKGDPAIYNALSATAGDPRILRAHQDAVRDITISADGKYLYSCGDDQQVLRWDLTETKNAPVAATLPRGLKENFRAIMLTKNGKWLVAGTISGKLIVWNTDNFPFAAQEVEAHTQIVNALRPDPVRKAFYSVASDGKVLRWNSEEMPFQHSLIDQLPEAVQSAALSPDGNALALALASGKIKLILLAGNSPALGTIKAVNSPVRVLRFSPDAKTLLMGCLDGALRSSRFDGSSLDEAVVLAGRHISGINALDFDPAGKHISSASYDQTIRLSQFPLTEESPVTISSHEGWVYGLSYSPDGLNIISCSADRSIRIFSSDEQQIAHQLQLKVRRNFSHAEWAKVIGADVPYQKTINELP